MSSRCGDQVFGSRVTTSTLAGEYVTAREYVGGRASCGNCGTSSSCTRSGIRGKLWWTTYVLLKRGRLTMELGVVMTRKTLVSLVLLRVLVVVSGQGGTEVDTSAGRLSEAKTQRRPTARERERVREGGFPLLFCCFCIFL